jgi:hypothetical protein
MGLIASQLGNVVQSAVGDHDRSEAGGLQYTAQQLGSSLGTALIGAVLISGLIASFTAKVEDNPEFSSVVNEQVGIAVEGGVSFVSTDEVEAQADTLGIPADETEALVASYSESQLTALKTALLVAGLIVLAALPATRRLPAQPLGESPAEPGLIAEPARSS